MFVYNDSLPAMPLLEGQKYPNVGYEICEAMQQVRNVRYSNINGATKIKGCWRLDLKGQNAHLARASILANGLSIRGHMISVMGENPFLVDGRETNRLTISNLPLSVSNDAVKSVLLDMGLRFSENLKWDMYRDNAGNQTSFKNGKRFVYIPPPAQPLPKTIKVNGMFTAYLNYKGPLPKDDILIDQQTGLKEQPGYTPDSDSDTDLDDEDQILKGLSQPGDNLPGNGPRSSSPINNHDDMGRLDPALDKVKDLKMSQAFSKLFEGRGRNADRFAEKSPRTRSNSLAKRKLPNIDILKTDSKKQRKNKKAAQKSAMSDSNNNASSDKAVPSSSKLVTNDSKSMANSAENNIPHTDNTVSLSVTASQTGTHSHSIISPSCSEETRF